MAELEIKNLRAESGGKEILRGVNLTVKTGEVQALLGPNASGKSTLAQVVLGNPKYRVSKGKIIFKRKNITRLSPEKRSKLGLAMAWQNPPTVKGLTLSRLLEKIGENKNSPDKLSFGSDLKERELNLNFSGGEKKISEIMQILSLNPELVIFDEIDSGLDIKKMEAVSGIIKKELVKKKVSVILITHSGEILKFLKPDFVNIMLKGKIICRQKDFRKVLKTVKKYGYEKCKRQLSAN
jgi:Fe-S cluster assembly ATP-binding protein